eukprot:TRINITY_DN42213_c0_g2_i1.p1 TRINITY_DN42213_c0_g2~~TRINITY_DN42213_c0_g2_i1.p1  ORF type:complete len:312 (+),score=29.09 TRINITY_DN42213_c0_g2_i1:89-1024(+)
MSSRAHVDACIDAFWSTAGQKRPVTHQELAKSRPAESRVPKLPVATKRSPSATPDAVEPSGAASNSEFRKITVEISGRCGYNAEAVNGCWRFWRVRGNRLAFLRDLDLDGPSDDVGLDELAPSGPMDALDVACQKASRTRLRLFLYYHSHVDAWVISDSPDAAGSICADCGPVAGDDDLGQHWRVWDGEGWKEDRNIVSEIVLDGPMPANLQGLRLAPAAPKLCTSARTRSASQEPSSSSYRSSLGGSTPMSARAPLDSRPPLGERRPTQGYAPVPAALSARLKMPEAPPAIPRLTENMPMRQPLSARLGR